MNLPRDRWLVTFNLLEVPCAPSLTNSLVIQICMSPSGLPRVLYSLDDESACSVKEGSCLTSESVSLIANDVLVGGKC